MKNILLLSWFISFSVYAQTNPDLTKMAGEFGSLVNENIGLFPPDDVKLINEFSYPSMDTLEIYWFQLENLPISDNFMYGRTAKIQLLYQLDHICQPFWEKEFNSPEEANAAHVELNKALDNFKNGKVAQYLFVKLLLIQGSSVRIIQYHRE